LTVTTGPAPNSSRSSWRWPKPMPSRCAPESAALLVYVASCFDQANLSSPLTPHPPCSQQMVLCDFDQRYPSGDVSASYDGKHVRDLLSFKPLAQASSTSCDPAFRTSETPKNQNTFLSIPKRKRDHLHAPWRRGGTRSLPCSCSRSTQAPWPSACACADSPARLWRP